MSSKTNLHWKVSSRVDLRHRHVTGIAGITGSMPHHAPKLSDAVRPLFQQDSNVKTLYEYWWVAPKQRTLKHRAIGE